MAAVTEQDLLDRGIELIAISFVDNAGLTRAKSITAARAEAAAARGLGSPKAFSIFTGEDGMATSTGYEATGDTRLVPDLDRLAGGLDGWGWAPGDLLDQEGEPWEFCTRSFLKRQAARVAEAGFEMRMTFEHEWYAETNDGVPAHSTPAYSLNSTAEAGAYLREVARRLVALGVTVEQIHPEYSAGQMEVSVGVADPVGAADNCVATRHAIRTAWPATGIRPSFAPLARPDGLGNGCHLHFSLWRDGRNLLGSDADDELGIAPEGRAFMAGVLREFRALAALGCGCPLSYRRLAPNRWTGAYVCWGTENREAPLRFIRGARAARPGGANAEVKTLDCSANPYLVAGGVIAAGLAGLAENLQLPEPVQIEPSRVAGELGLELLPDSLDAAADTLAGSQVLREALGQPMHDAIVAVRRAEAMSTAGRDEHQLFEFYRWRY
jgi:glutamine synthetase